MGLEKCGISRQKSRRAAHSRRVEDLVVEAWSEALAIRRRLCDFLIALFTLVIVFAGTVIVLYGGGAILLPPTTLTVLTVVVFGAAPRMLVKIVNSVFKR